MEKYAYFFFLSLLLPMPFSKADTEGDYRTLCSYDKKWCGKLKNSDGTWVKPKKEIVLLLKELGPTIQKNAASLGVDPQAVAGAIMAENSLNVSISDDVQDLLVKIGVANKGEILGKKFTYGLGQLNFEAAREAENYVANLENRSPISDRALSDALLIPERAIYYVAAVLRKCQDDYKKQGIDIAGKPEILTTLYNLGHSDTKSVELKNAGSTPRPNYFGFFVKQYKNELSFLAKAAPVVVPEKVVISKKEAAPLGPVKAPAAVIKAPVETRKLKLAFNKSMPIYTAPPTCDIKNEYGATDLKNKYSSMKAFSVVAIADKEKSFQVIAPSIDCESNTWELIKLSTGEIGWIKKDDLDKTTSKILIAEPKCVSKIDLQCSAQIKEQLKKQVLTESTNRSEIFLSPKSNSKKTAFKNPDWQCREKVETEEDNSPYGSSYSNIPSGNSSGNGGISGGFGTSGGGFYGNPANTTAKKIGAPKNSDADLAAAISKIDQKILEIETNFKAPINDPRNPMASIPLPMFKENIKKCVNKQLYKLDNCQLDLGQIDKLLAQIDSKKRPGKDELGLLNYNLSVMPMGLPVMAMDAYKQMLKNSPFGMMMGNGMGYSSFGWPGMGGLDSQYAFREGDETLWKLEDISEAMNECNTALIALQDKITNDVSLEPNDKQMMIGGVQALLAIANASKEGAELISKMTPDKKAETWKETQGEFVQSAKLCLAIDDLFNLKIKKNNEQPTLRNYNCFYQNLTVLENGPTLMLKELVNESMYTGMGLSMLAAQSQLAFNAFKMISLGLVPSMGGAGTYPTAGNTAGNMPAYEAPASYCPNKTAEMIEEMVKNNPCISKVYLPDKWLINRLNELGDKVVYKPFADDDRFSVEVEKTQCK